MIKILLPISCMLINYFACSQFALVWSDDFTIPTIDAGKWVHETGGHVWGNNESQMHTTNSANLSVTDGKLTFTAL